MKNKTIYIIAGIIIFIIIIILAKGSSGSKNSNTTLNNTNQSSNQVVDKNTHQQNVTSTTSNDPQDIVPGLYKNMITNNSTVSGLTIVSGLVENNLDTNGKPTNDHLELVLKNSSKIDMKNLEVYYTITDLSTQKKEGYYKKLAGFTLKAGRTETIHFDNKTGINHFGLNTNGMYFTGRNKMQFNVQVSAPGFKIATIQIAKDAGGAEQKD